MGASLKLLARVTRIRMTLDALTAFGDILFRLSFRNAMQNRKTRRINKIGGVLFLRLRDLHV